MALEDFIIKNGNQVLSLDRNSIKIAFSNIQGNMSDVNKAKLESLHISDLDKWTNKEKNIFFNLLVDNNKMNNATRNNIEHIVKIYNKEIANNEIDRISLFSSLGTINKFLESMVYQDPQFQKDINEKAMSWIIYGEKNKFKLLKEAFNNLIDIKTIKSYISIDPEQKKNAQDYIENKISINQIKKDKSLNKTAITSYVTIAMMIQITDITMKVYDGINANISKVSPYLASNPNITAIAIVGAIGFAYYKTYQTLNTVILKGADIYSANRIEGTSPDKINEKYLQKNLSQKLIGEIINNENYDITDNNNKKYLALVSFLNEKIYQPSITLSSNLKSILNLSKEQYNKLNTLSLENIHEIANISSPTGRMILLTNDVNNAQKQMLLNLSNIDQVKFNNKNKGSLIKINCPDEVNNDLKNKITQMNNLNKELTNYYLNLNKRKDLNNKEVCTPQLCEDLLNNLKNGKSIQTILLSEIENQQKNEIETYKLKNKNLTIQHVKRVGNIILFKEILESNNTDIKKELLKIAQDNNFTQNEKIINSYASLVDNVKTNTAKIITKLKKIRDNIFGNGSNPLTP